MSATIADILFQDDAAAMRVQAHEHAMKPGPLGDMARYLLCALDDRERCLKIMEAATYSKGRRAFAEAAKRRHRRTDTKAFFDRHAIPGQHRYTLTPAPRMAKLRPMPNPISDREIELALKEA